MASPSLEHTPLTRLKGVGPALEKKLSHLGIRNVLDLLFHLPLRYEDRTQVHAIGRVAIGEHVQLQGEVVSTSIQFGRRRSLLCVIRDNSGVISLRFFHFSAAQKDGLRPGSLLRCYGEVRRGRTGMEIYHPEYRIVDKADELPVESTLTAIYPATDGLQQGRFRSLIKQALALMEKGIEVREYLPTGLLERFGLAPLNEAIRLSHQPPVEAAVSWSDYGGSPGQRRLAFEELLAHRLCMRRFRQHVLGEEAPRLAANERLQVALLAQFPFELTQAQRRVGLEIQRDLDSGHPMLRLLQGDVGSGKTVVAALAALHAIGAGHQVALMAPTEILAEQHLSNFSRWFSPLGIAVGWLSGKSKGQQRCQQLQALASGDCQLVVGTHALFQEGVDYRSLGLIVIDEQHRFGVHQRLALRQKAVSKTLNPHQLIMTATPIPRTLAMSAYADLDCSIIDELPPGRVPVNTAIVSSDRRSTVIERIEKACLAGQQAYWVCTMIDESELMQCQAAEATAELLKQQLPGINVGLIHGRMKSDDKAAIMAGFSSGATQLLVATTVIEVGVDVPNASLMVIENPERLGLSQLHQLRGRIGRGHAASHCILLYQAPLSHAGKTRLRVLRESNDGFYIAQKDLELRGPGQVLGTQQTGVMNFRVADIARDASLLEDVREASELLQEQQPELVEPLISRWLGDNVDYANV